MVKTKVFVDFCRVFTFEIEVFLGFGRVFTFEIEVFLGFGRVFTFEIDPRFWPCLYGQTRGFYRVWPVSLRSVRHTTSG